MAFFVAFALLDLLKARIKRNWGSVLGNKDRYSARVRYRLIARGSHGAGERNGTNWEQVALDTSFQNGPTLSDDSPITSPKATMIENEKGGASWRGASRSDGLKQQTGTGKLQGTDISSSTSTRPSGFRMLKICGM